MNIQEQDALVALSFWAQRNAAKIKKQFEHELDWELRGDPQKCGVFLSLMQNGADPVFAKMTACRKTAAFNGSDQHFNAHARRRMDRQYESLKGGLEMAKRAGISTQGKFYCGSLGTYDNPRAWVSTIDDIVQSCKDQRLTCEGATTYTHPTSAPKVGPSLAPDLIQESVKEELSANPRLAREYQKRPDRVGAELREKVVAKYGRPKRYDSVLTSHD